MFRQIFLFIALSFTLFLNNEVSCQCTLGCLNGGLCVVVNNAPYCACAGTFTGTLCEVGSGSTTTTAVSAIVTTTTATSTTTQSSCGLNCLNGEELNKFTSLVGHLKREFSLYDKYSGKF